MMRSFSGISIFIWLVLVACSPKKPQLENGIWRGVIEMQEQSLPFNFEIDQTNGVIISLVNGTEKIPLDEIEFFGDSIRIVMHIFDSEIRARVNSDTLNGYFVKNYAPEFKYPFSAGAGESFRFVKDETQSSVDFSGTYGVEFLHEEDTISEISIAVGIFKQNGNTVTGTFLMNNGDYRFLQGNVVDSELWLSTFDGNHSFIFRANKYGDTLRGDFWSGAAWHETWTGIKDDNATLPKNESLTYLREGFEKIEFSFPDLEGIPVTDEDDRFKNKVVILQIFGTWCPNCMDETKFLANWYKENQKRGVEILGLAYERKDDFDYASGRVRKMKQRLGVDYDFCHCRHV
ncbi:MAG: TlpA family protein disulfide reductase [Flammeovirgaceae bacterium]|nr:TlpA family protein disulfide reductase [Flammeovirgaceae bacterium]